MALPSSGALSLNQMHVEAGGTTGTQASINDADIRNLISKSSGATMSFNEWYGASSSDDTISISVGTYTEPSGKYPTTYTGYLYDMSQWSTQASSGQALGSISDSSISLGGTSYTIKGVFTSSNSLASGFIIVLDGNVGAGGLLSTLLGVDYLKNGTTIMANLTQGTNGYYQSGTGANYTYWSVGSVNTFASSGNYTLTFTD